MCFRAAPGVIQWKIAKGIIREPLALTPDSTKPHLPAMWHEMGHDNNLISNPPEGLGGNKSALLRSSQVPLQQAMWT